MRLLLLSSTLWVMSLCMRKPDLYVWLEQNSYICELPSGKNSQKFLSPNEAKQFTCDCGDPLISHTACARIGQQTPSCHQIPALCMTEYEILFTETPDRLAQPLTTRSTTTTTEPTTKTPVTTPAPPTRRQSAPVFRQLQRQNSLPRSRRPLNKEIVNRNRAGSRPSTPSPSKRRNLFALQSRFLLPRRPARTEDRGRPLPRIQPLSRFRTNSRGRSQLFNRRPPPATTEKPPTQTQTTKLARPTESVTSTTSIAAATSAITTTTPKKTTTTRTTTKPTSTTTTTAATTTTTETPTTTAATVKTTTTVATTMTTPKPTTIKPKTTSKSSTTITTIKSSSASTLTTPLTTSTATITTTTAATTAETLATSTLTVQDHPTTVADAIKQSKTELLIAELSNRMRELGHDEPEHPLMDLREFFESKGKLRKEAGVTTLKPSTASEAAAAVTTTTTPAVITTSTRVTSNVADGGTTTSTTSAPLINREKVARNLKKTSGEVSMTFEDQPVVDSELGRNSMSAPSNAVVTIKSIEGSDVVAKKAKSGVDGTVSGGTQKEAKESHLTDIPILMKTTHPREIAEALTENIPEKEAEKTSTASFPWQSHSAAIEFLRAKLEMLEKQLMQRLGKTDPEVSGVEDSNIVASNDELSNTRRQSRLDSRRRGVINGGDVTVDFLNSIDSTIAVERSLNEKAKVQESKTVADSYRKEPATNSSVVSPAR